jgi:hypothetical protein
VKRLELADILDLREYERVRPEYLQKIIAKKKLRRVHVGPLVSLVFENRDTVVFQIQEMARAEKISTDEGIQVELDIYNSLIPDLSELKATLFIELTSEADLKEWLPKLVGIEKSVFISDVNLKEVIYSVPLSEHEKLLTKEDITASVHYISFNLSSLKEDLTVGKFIVGIEHKNYNFRVEIDGDYAREVLSDLEV